jgi:prohibitin 1
VQLLTQREKVSSEIRESIKKRAAQFGILMDDVSITHLTYGKEFAKAIEEKQVAEQDAERQKFVVLKSEQERQATIIKSEGEAEAARLINEALLESGNGVIEVRRIDAAKDIAETLAKSPNVMYLPHGQQMLLNVGGGGGGQRPQQ